MVTRRDIYCRSVVPWSTLGSGAPQLAGAWIANIFKKKRDELEVDAWRGVQVAGQVAKVLTGWLQPYIAPQLRKFAGPD